MSEISAVRARKDEECPQGLFQAGKDSPSEHPADTGLSGGSKNATELLLDEAARIAEEISSRAIPGRDGCFSWPGCGSDSVTERPPFVPTADSFYEGSCGVAFFLAAVYRATGTNRFKEVALGAIKRLRGVLRSEGRGRLGLELTLGAGNGVGGLVYGLTRISGWLDEPQILEEACLAAETISKESIERDERLDVMLGSAGAILGLLSLWKATARDRWIEEAGWCANHLLKHREACNGHAAWKTCGAPQPLTGYAHGAAGIAHALLMLFKQSGETELMSAAREAIAYESSVFCADVNNWPDFRPWASPPQAGQFMTAWCHGAPGIGLSRTAVLGLGMDSQAVRDIENAAACVMATPLGGADHLCCGTMGHVEFLVSAGHYLNQRDVIIAGLRRAAWVRRRRDRCGSYQVPVLAGHPNPFFFQGESGIGYQILRLACPDEYPCVALWQ